jgi:hypothetical protein
MGEMIGTSSRRLIDDDEARVLIRTVYEVRPIVQEIPSCKVASSR